MGGRNEGGREGGRKEGAKRVNEDEEIEVNKVSEVIDLSSDLYCKLCKHQALQR